MGIVMATDNNWEVEIEKINSEVKLCKAKLDTIENNHLFHIQKDIDRLNKILWVIGVMVFSQLLYVVRDVIL